MTRQEHMDWCKKQALEYCDRNEPQEAITSMLSDLRKHQETENHAGVMLAAGLLLAGQLRTTEEVRKFIQGFN